MNRPLPRAIAALLLACLALLAPATATAQRFPELTGRVVDDAAIIRPDVEARLDQKLAALETQSRRQLVVATISDLDGYDIADYGYRLGRHWGIGSKERNDGALLIVAPHERKLRIEVGYGLEGVLTDGMSSLIINQTVVPRFKAGDMAGGIEAGTDAIIQQLSLPEAEAQKLAKEADAAAEGPGAFWPLMFVLGFVVVFIWLLSRGRSGRRRYRGSSGAPVVIWGSGNDSSSWSGGFDSGSDFSGGGGDFGGGGASGDW